jgi:ankyrin repeat protein
LTEETADVKIIRVLAAVALALVVLAAAGLFILRLLPRARPETPVAAAAAHGSPDELRRELQRRGSPNAKDAQGFTALDWAARNGRTAAVAELVRAGADPDLRDSGPNGWTPLMHAVHKNQLGSVRALLAAGAAPDGRADNGLTPLMLAAAQGEPEIVEELLQAGADPRLHGPIGWTALEQAVGNGNPKVVDALLRKDPGLRLENTPRVWALRAMAWVGGRSELLDRIDRGPETGR